ncbi:phage tail tape measure protein [Streptomyces sp. NPDC004232]|uniref:phage tail tape measure protein n=1 Tax=Streptomyces sp. NPDC004232 TaxID=3154454 RepID=UPI0033B64F8A
MAGVEAFTIMAILDAKDRISGVLNHVDETLSRFSSTAATAADAARTAGAAIDESFLQTASGADAAEVADARLAATRANLFRATQEQAAAERELLAAQAEAAVAVDDYAASDARLIAANERLVTSQRAVVTATEEVAVAERGRAAAAGEGAAVTAASTTGLGRWGGTASKAGEALQIAGKAAIGLGVVATAIGYESIKASSSFQTLTTNLVTSAGESASKLKMVQQGILGISTDTATSSNTLAKAMYQIESASFHGADGLMVLKAASQGAKDENADATTVAKGLTTALVNYHLPASDAAKVTSQMVTAVSHGKTTFQEFSASLANVLPTASAAHLKLADVVSVLAQMTNAGFPAQRASMNMANALRHLTNFTSVQTKEFAKMNITADEVKQHLSSEGLGGTLIWLDGIAKSHTKTQADMVAALQKLTGSASGANVALSLSGKGADQYRAALKDVSGATTEAGGNVKGFGEIQKTFAFQMDKAKNAIHNAGIAIGTALLPAVTKIAGAIAKVVTPIAGWVEKHQKLTAIVLGSIAAIGALTLVVTALGTAIDVLFSWVGLIVVGIAALVAGIIYAYKHFATFRTIVNEVGAFLKGVFVAAWRIAGDVVNWFSKNVMPLVKEAIKAVFDWFSAHKEDFKKAWDTVVHAVKDIAKWFDDNVVKWLRGIIGDFISWWHSHSQSIHQVWKAVWDLVKAEAKAVWGYLKAALSILGSAFKVAWDVISGVVKTAWALIKGVVTTGIHAVLNVIGIVLDLITGKWGKAWQDVKKLVTQGLHDVVSTIKSVASSFGNLLLSAGKDLIRGLINGVESMGGALFGSLKSLAGGALKAAKDALGIGSPSKLFRDEVGKWIPHGIAAGVVEHGYVAMRAVTKVTSGLPTALSRGAGSLTTSLTAGGFAGGLVGAAAAGTGGNIIIDVHDITVMSDQDVNKLVDRIGRQLATRVLPAGGVRIRM